MANTDFEWGNATLLHEIYEPKEPLSGYDYATGEERVFKEGYGPLEIIKEPFKKINDQGKLEDFIVVYEHQTNREIVFPYKSKYVYNSWDHLKPLNNL